MKKILLASTALVGLAGAAAADVKVSGSAEMGIMGGSAIDTQFIQSVDVRFAMTGETDGGLTFGATIDLDDSQDTAVAGRDTVDSTTFSDFTVFISGDFGTLTMGDTDGAMDWALTEAGNMGNPGSIADDETAHAGYQGSYLDGDGDGQILRYNYSFDAFSFAISMEQNAAATETGFAIGAKYSADLGGGSLGIGIGYQEAATAAANPETATGISLVYSSDMGLTAGIVYTDFSNGPNESHLGLGVAYSTGALTVHANYGEYDTGAATVDGFGLAVAYDLGGGASVHFGYGDDAARDTFSLGLAMSF